MRKEIQNKNDAKKKLEKHLKNMPIKKNPYTAVQQKPKETKS